MTMPLSTTWRAEEYTADPPAPPRLAVESRMETKVSEDDLKHEK